MVHLIALRKNRTCQRTRRLVKRALLAATFLAGPHIAGSPVAHWSFDGPTVAERLKERYGSTELDALEVSSNLWSTRPGFGNVLANGSNPPYLTVPRSDTLNFGTGDFSVTLWIRRTGGSNQSAALLDALDQTGTGFQLLFRNTNQVRLRLDDDQNNSINADVGTPHLNQNSWQHFVATVDRTANRLKFYINGTVDNPAGIDISSLTGAINPDQDLLIGRLNTDTPPYGQLDDLAFFDRILTATEIAALNASGGTPVLSVFPAAPAVTITPAGGPLRPADSVTMATAPGFDIVYTLDGSTPTVESPRYEQPLALQGSVALRARARDGSVLGPVNSASFVSLPAAPPNIVLIVGDNVGFNDLGCYGAVTTATPHLDALAASGCRFPQFTTAGPSDLASQYALLTGRLPRRAGLPSVLAPGTPGLDSREWTLAEALRKAGYETAFIGSWHLGDLPGSRPHDQGFALFHGLPAGPTLAPLAENDTILDPNPDPGTLLESFVSRAEAFLLEQSEAPFFLLFQPPALPAAGGSLLGDYGNQIEALDTATGRLLDQLETQDLTDTTLVLFLSDEGARRNTGSFPTGSNGQLRDGGGTTWEGGVRTPFLSRWPEVIPPASISYQTIWLPELFASLVELADSYLAPDRPLDSTEQLATLLCADHAPDPEHTLFIHTHNGTEFELATVRQGSWKLHQSYKNLDPENTTSADTPLLFDLLVDPTERIDRSDQQATLLASLQTLATLHEATFSTPVPQLPPVREAFLSTPATSFSPDGQSIHYEFTRPTDSLDDHYRIQHGTDLLIWNDLPITGYVASITPLSETTEMVQLLIPLDTPEFSGPEQFIRLKAARP